MELNKNIYFGDNLVLTINWNCGTKIGHTNDTATGGLGTNAADFTVPLQLSNLFYILPAKLIPLLFHNLCQVLITVNLV